MPALAIPAFWAAVSAGAGAGAGIYAANKTAGAARDAANLQANTATQAGQLQSRAAADALQFQKDQAARDQANFLATQQANYGQFAAHKRNLNSLASMLGLPQQDVPGLPEYLSGGGSGASGATPSSATAGIPAGALDVYNSVRSQNPTPTASSLDDLAKAYQAKGFQVSRPNYNGVPSGNELIVNGQKLKFTVGDVGSPNASWYTWGTPDSGSAGAGSAGGSAYSPYSLAGMMGAPSSTLPLTPALVAPNPYSLAGLMQPRRIG